MFFKKKQDKIRRCAEGHILDPSWTHCPYCQDQAEPAASTPPAAVPAPTYSAGPGFAPPPSHAAPPAHAQPPVYAPPPGAAPPAHSAGGLDENLDKTVVNPRVAPPAPPPPAPPPASPPPDLFVTAPAAVDDGEEDPDITRVQRPGPPAAAASPPAFAAAPPAAAPPPAPPAAPALAAPIAAVPPLPAPLREPAAMPQLGADDVTRILPRASGPRSLVAWLVVVEGDYRGRDFRLSGPRLHVGIAPDCEICLPEESYLSRHHAELELIDGDYVLRDLASRNGTFVNGERVESSILRDGDAVRLGLTHMIYRTLLI